MSTTTIPDPTKVDNTPTKIESLGAAFSIFFKHISPWIIGGTAVFAWSARVWMGSWSWWDLLFGAAILAFWPLQEWLIHVFILHFKPRTFMGRKVDMHVSHMHRVHHRIPWVLEYVFVPTRTVIATVVVGLPLFMAVWSQALPIEIGLTGVSVFATFGLVYEWTHFLIHTNYRPKSAFYKKLWQNHRWHHFKNENYWYGVSRTGGDVLLRTAPDPSSVEKSPTCRTLGVAGHDEVGGEAA